MIKHTIYPDKVVATYSEGDCWHETIAEYFKKHTNFEEHIIDNIVDEEYTKRYNSGMKFMGIAKYSNTSDIKIAGQIATARLRDKYNHLMIAIIKRIIAYYEQDIMDCIWKRVCPI